MTTDHSHDKAYDILMRTGSPVRRFGSTLVSVNNDVSFTYRDDEKLVSVVGPANSFTLSSDGEVLNSDGATVELTAWNPRGIAKELSDLARNPQ